MLPIMSNSTLGSIYMTNLSGNLLSFVLFQLPNLDIEIRRVKGTLRGS
jgi:hypothetical protein